MDKPSIQVWIDPKTQSYKIDFTPQVLSPAEYGVMLSAMMLHIARLFHESNPQHSIHEIIDAMQRGVMAGLEQLKDVALPSKPH